MLLLLPSLLLAQAGPDRKWYVRAGGGYAIPLMGQNTILNGNTFSGSRTVSLNGPGWQQNASISTTRGTLGAGAVFSAAGGYMLSPHISVELGVQSVALAPEYRYRTEYIGAITSILEQQVEAKPSLAVIPALVLMSGGKGFRAHGRAGLILPVADRFSLKQSQYSGTGAGPDSYYEYELTHRFSVGFQGAAGVSYPVAKRISLWAEAAGSFRNAFTKRSEVVRYEQRGIDRLEALTTNSKVTELEFKLSAGPGNPDEPGKALTSATPYSSIGLNVGIPFGF